MWQCEREWNGDVISKSENALHEASLADDRHLRSAERRAVLESWPRVQLRLRPSILGAPEGKTEAGTRISRLSGRAVVGNKLDSWLQNLSEATSLTAILPEPSACRGALQGVHNSITETVKEVANEPSVGLYFVQQHVHKAVPGLLALKSHVVEATEEIILYAQDVNDALASVRVMNEVGPPVFSKIISTLNASLLLLPTLYHPNTSSRSPPVRAHLPRSASHHGAVALPSSQPGTKSRVLLESSIPEATGKPSRVLSSAEERSVVLPRSSPSQGNTKSSSTSQTDTPNLVSGFLSSAYQRASSVRMSMPIAFEANERVAKQANATEVSTTPSNSTSSSGSNAGFIPSIPYWNVVESAIQKAGHMVSAGSIGSGDSSRTSLFVRRFSSPSLSESALIKPSLEASDVGESSASRELEDLEKEDDEGHTGLDLEDPQVVESFARLQQEQEAKLEAWLGISIEDEEAMPQS